LTKGSTLIRWNDVELGFVPPDHFIPVAEETGLIHELGVWVVLEASRQLKIWQDSGEKDLSVAVNVSGRQLERPEFFQQVKKIIHESGIKPGTFYIELTESAIIQGQKEVLETLEKFRAIGVRVALDDFGTGYSSLSYLRNLPIDILKIDRSFIEELGEQNNSVILSAIITMAQALNMKVIAEGIEEQGQFAFLQKTGCDMLQGFLFHRSKPVKKITEMLMKGTCLSMLK
jgi:EAL domain-containing protein (putative c-di-GMP-specific phosphodiesterase class I)